ncbi:MAG: hypothetical protein HXX11_04695 [Desulfuromonadales bacterium]|nr:hypothetical protein [Desulfuromonadales bacterium]
MRAKKIFVSVLMFCFFSTILCAAPMTWRFNQQLERIEQGRYVIGGVAYVLSRQVKVFIAPGGNQAEANLVPSTVDSLRPGDIVTIQEQGASILVITISRR